MSPTDYKRCPWCRRVVRVAGGMLVFHDQDGPRATRITGSTEHCRMSGLTLGQAQARIGKESRK